MNNTIDFSSVTVESLQNAFTQYTQGLKEMNDRIINLNFNKLTYSNVFNEMIKFEHILEPITAIFKLKQLHTDKTVRDKCTSLSVEMSQFIIEQNMRKDVYKVYRQYYDNNFQTEKLNLYPEQIRYVEKVLLNLDLLGLNLADEQHNRAKEINKTLAECSQKFNKNLSDNNTTFYFSKEELSGMTDEWLSNRLQENGTYKVTLKYPDYIPLIEECSCRETRKIIVTSFNSRCKEENNLLLVLATYLRKDLSQIFGYSNFADYKLIQKMAKNAITVNNFLDNLDNNLTRALENDLQLLKNISITDGVDDLQSYDISYYSRLYIKEQLNYDKNELKKFFALSRVTEGLFNIYQNLLGFRFLDVTQQYANTLWHESVKLFEVYDTQTNNLVGQFYLDLYPRDGKYGHACMMDVVTKSSRNLPVVFMVCNFPENENLSFDDVETYFHEFGHVMHGISSEASISGLGGTNCETDFVECPSQLFEEWCYCEQPLKLMAPDITSDAIEFINKDRKMMKSIFHKRQLCIAKFDMALHNEHSIVNNAKLFNDIYSKSFNFNMPSEINFGATFGHIMGGYEAGYYSYLWSQVYAKDIYKNKFKGHELDPVVGKEFRHKILSKGGTADSIDILTEYLGCPPNSRAFSDSFLF